MESWCYAICKFHVLENKRGSIPDYVQLELSDGRQSKWVQKLYNLELSTQKPYVSGSTIISLWGQWKN